jgi:hypothetical protein
MRMRKKPEDELPSGISAPFKDAFDDPQAIVKRRCCLGIPGHQDAAQALCGTVCESAARIYLRESSEYVTGISHVIVGPREQF